MAQPAVVGAFGMLHLPHQVGADPFRIAPVRGRDVVDRRGLPGAGAQPARDLLEIASGEPGAHAAGVVQIPARVGDGDQEGTDRPGPLPLAVAPPDHHDLLVTGVLELDPGAGALARPVDAALRLRHHPFELELLRQGDRLVHVAMVGVRQLDVLGGVHRLEQPVAPLPVGGAQQRVASLHEQVEEHDVDLDVVPGPLDVALPGEAEPLLEAREGGPVPAVQGHDLPVEDGLPRLPQGRRHGVDELGELGERDGEVLAAAAGQTDPVAQDGRDDTHPVPLHLEGPLVLVADVLTAPEGGEHRRDRVAHLDVLRGPRGGGAWSLCAVGLGLVLHQVQQPVRLRLLLRRGGAARSSHAAGVEEGEASGHAAEPAVRTSVADDDHLAALAPFLDLDRAGVPDGDVPAAVLALGDGALEGAVLEGMVLGLHGQAVHVRLERRPLGHRPGDQHPLVLEAEVVVQARGVVLLDHEHRLGAVERLLRGLAAHPGAGHGLGRVLGVPLRAVHLEPVAGLPGRRAAALLVQPEGREGVDPALDPFEHLGHLEVCERGVLDLLPRARGGDGGPQASAEGVGADGGLLAVVLRPVHEDLAGALRTGLGADHLLGMVGLERAGELVRDLVDLLGARAAVQRRVEVYALGAGGHREALEAHVGEDLAAPARHTGALRQAGPLAGVEVQDHPVGMGGLEVRVEAPLGRVDLERGELGEPDEDGRLVHERVGGDAVAVLDVCAWDPVGGVVLEVLAEEHLARRLGGAHPVHPALARRRATRRLRDHDRGDAVVVVDHLALGGARGRVEDLVEVRQPQPAPVDVHLLLSSGHVPTVPPITGSVTRRAAVPTDRSWRRAAPRGVMGHARDMER